MHKEFSADKLLFSQTFGIYYTTIYHKFNILPYSFIVSVRQSYISRIISNYGVGGTLRIMAVTAA